MNESKPVYQNKLTGKTVDARRVGVTTAGELLQPDTDDSGNRSDWMPGVMGPDGQFHPAYHSKIVIDLPPDATMQLDQLMRQTGDDPTALFQKSLALYRLVTEAIREGKAVGTASDPDSLETRFTGL
jgi:hypothetical protein